VIYIDIDFIILLDPSNSNYYKKNRSLLIQLLFYSLILV